MPGGAAQDATAVGASQQGLLPPVFWGQKASPQVPGDDSHIEELALVQGSTDQQPSQNALIETLHRQHMSHDSHGVQSTALNDQLGNDQLGNAGQSSPQPASSYWQDPPDSAEHAQRGSDAHGLNPMVKHLSGQMPSSANSADEDDAGEAEDEGVTDEDNSTVWERKRSSMTDIDVLN